MVGKSFDIQQNNVITLRELFPNVFSEVRWIWRLQPKIIALQPQKVIVLDRFFTNYDELKANIALGMTDEGVEFKTI
jgi:hypothetical protein